MGLHVHMHRYRGTPLPLSMWKGRAKAVLESAFLPSVPLGPSLLSWLLYNSEGGHPPEKARLPLYSPPARCLCPSVLVYPFSLSPLPGSVSTQNPELGPREPAGGMGEEVGRPVALILLESLLGPRRGELDLGPWTGLPCQGKSTAQLFLWSKGTKASEGRHPPRSHRVGTGLTCTHVPAPIPGPNPWTHSVVKQFCSFHH